MFDCYYNIQNKEKIGSGELSACSEQLPQQYKLCKKHQLEYWGEEKKRPWETKQQIQTLKRIKGYGYDKLAHSELQDRYKKAVEFMLVGFDDLSSEKREIANDKLEAIEDELKRRGLGVD